MVIDTPNQVSGNLAGYTRPELIVARLREYEPAGVIGELSQLLHRQGYVRNVLSFYNAVLNHEFLSNSGNAVGIAIPHGRDVNVSRLIFAVGRTSEPIVWGIKGAWPVQLVFLVAIPATGELDYLHLLSRLARLCQKQEMLRKLCRATDGAAMWRVLEESEREELPGGSRPQR